MTDQESTFDTTMALRDGQIHELSWTHNIGESLTLGDTEIPATRFWEAVIDGADPADLVEDALDAAVYATDLRRVVVITDKVYKDAESMYESQQGWRIVKRRESVRKRPYLVGTLARFETQPDPAKMTALFMVMSMHGREPVAMVDGKVMFMREGLRDKVYAKLGISEDYKANAHVMVRAGVLMKRPGGYTQALDIPARRFAEKDNDGTIMISEQLDAPRQGTMTIKVGNEVFYLKGVVRPPLTDGAYTELTGICENAQFGKDLPANLPQRANFASVRTLPVERVSLDYQAVMFNAENPEDVIRKDNRRLEQFQLSDLFTKTQMRKVNAGVPAALLMNEYAPWKWLRQFQVKGARALVLGSEMVDVGQVGLLPETAKRIEQQCGGSIPPFLCLHRDPATPGNNSMACYEVVSVLHFEGKDINKGDGFVLNPRDKAWKRAGGDFDGDAAAGFEPFFEQAELNDGMIPLREKMGVPLVQFDGTASVEATMIRMANGFSSRLGPSVNTALRLKEVGELTIDDEAAAHSVIQAAVDAKKHPVNIKEAYALYTELRSKMEGMTPEGGYMLDEIQLVKQAVGHEDKAKAWKQLGVWFKSFGNRSALTRAMSERYDILTRIFETTQWLKRDSVLPSEIKDAALIKLLDQSFDAIQATENVNNLTREYRRAVREYSDAGDDDERKTVAREAVQKARLDIRLAMRNGDISEECLIAYGPNRLAAEICSADTFESLKVKCGIVQLTAHGLWETFDQSKCDVRYLESCTLPGDKHKLNLIPEGVEKVELKVAKQHRTCARLFIQW